MGKEEGTHEHFPEGGPEPRSTGTRKVSPLGEVQEVAWRGWIEDPERLKRIIKKNPAVRKGLLFLNSLPEDMIDERILTEKYLQISEEIADDEEASQEADPYLAKVYARIQRLRGEEPKPTIEEREGPRAPEEVGGKISLAEIDSFEELQRAVLARIDKHEADEGSVRGAERTHLAVECLAKADMFARDNPELTERVALFKEEVISRLHLLDFWADGFKAVTGGEGIGASAERALKKADLLKKGHLVSLFGIPETEEAFHEVGYVPITPQVVGKRRVGLQIRRISGTVAISDENKPSDLGPLVPNISTDYKDDWTLFKLGHFTAWAFGSKAANPNWGLLIDVDPQGNISKDWGRTLVYDLWHHPILASFWFDNLDRIGQADKDNQIALLRAPGVDPLNPGLRAGEREEIEELLARRGEKEADEEIKDRITRNLVRWEVKKNPRTQTAVLMPAFQLEELHPDYDPRSGEPQEFLWKINMGELDYTSMPDFIVAAFYDSALKREETGKHLAKVIVEGGEREFGFAWIGELRTKLGEIPDSLADIRTEHLAHWYKEVSDQVFARLETSRRPGRRTGEEAALAAQINLLLEQGLDWAFYRRVLFEAVRAGKVEMTLPSGEKMVVARDWTNLFTHPIKEMPVIARLVLQQLNERRIWEGGLLAREAFQKTGITYETILAFAGWKLLPLEDLNLSKKTKEALRRAGKTTIMDLRETTDEELLSIKGLGTRELREIKSKLKGQSGIDWDDDGTWREGRIDAEQEAALTEFFREKFRISRKKHLDRIQARLVKEYLDRKSTSEIDWRRPWGERVDVDKMVIEFQEMMMRRRYAVGPKDIRGHLVCDYIDVKTGRVQEKGLDRIESLLGGHRSARPGSSERVAPLFLFHDPNVLLWHLLAPLSAGWRAREAREQGLDWEKNRVYEGIPNPDKMRAILLSLWYAGKITNLELEYWEQWLGCTKKEVNDSNALKEELRIPDREGRVKEDDVAAGKVIETTLALAPGAGAAGGIIKTFPIRWRTPREFQYMYLIGGPVGLALGAWITLSASTSPFVAIPAMVGSYFIGAWLAKDHGVVTNVRDDRQGLMELERTLRRSERAIRFGRDPILGIVAMRTAWDDLVNAQEAVLSPFGESEKHLAEGVEAKG